MLDQKEYNEIVDNINKTISDSSKTLSDTCRYVVFALLAFVWTILMKENTLVSTKDKCVFAFFIGMVVYFIIDIAQYFITVVKYRKHANTLYDVITNLKSENKLTKQEIEQVIKVAEAKERSKINNISYYMFISKLTILAFALLCFFFIIKPYFI